MDAFIFGLVIITAITSLASYLHVKETHRILRIMLIAAMEEVARNQNDKM